ncbi:PIR Superfamily Protein [Plasmodium ovale wallikeri]|uniref:PIR Superfamily Protein n=1 Tax=Plasmodium ovale wallikeri TaxID=864142 RepID=A0A1A9AMY1_PLAOA|nr:PIR Superfamily Protein [Plasmodium ovale wallikeri]
MTKIRARQSYLAQLPSFQFNYELNKDVSKCTYCNICDEQDIIFPDEHAIKILCYSFVRNLEILINQNNVDTNKKNMYCNHLIYWIYQKYFSIFSESMAKPSNYIFEKLKLARNTFISFNTSSGNDFCENSFKNILPFSDIEKIKLYHDYYVNFKFIEQKSTKKDGNCYNYRDYLEGKKELYVEMVKQCKDDHVKKFCEHFSYEECDPDNLLKKQECHKQTTDSRGLDNKSDESEDCGLTEPKYVWEYCNNKVINLSDFRAILIIGLATWGIILTLFLLYKNTPVGLWIDRYIRRKEIFRRNFDEELENDMLSDNSDHADVNLERGRYSVGYYP